MGASAPEFNEAKFTELVLYICEKCLGAQRFGLTKLHKTLLGCDFDAYAAWGEPITGATYLKKQFGPVAQQLPSTVKALVKSGAAVLRATTLLGAYEEKRLVPLRAPDMNLFTAKEVVLIDSVIERLAPLTAVEASQRSHELRGWQLAQEGEVIPYFTVFLAETPAKISDEDMEWARREAEQFLREYPGPGEK